MIKGQSLSLRNEPFYDKSDSKVKSGTLYGPYYVWSNKIENGRIRITTEKSKAGVKGQELGWIDISFAKNANDIANSH